MDAARLILVEGMIGSGKTTTVEPWSSGNVAFVENSAWARHRRLRGRDAVVGLYRAWEPVAARLYDRCPFPKIRVTDPQDDLPAALARIGASVRPSVLTVRRVSSP